MAKIGAAVAATGLPAYGAYKVYDISVPKTIEVTRTISKQVPYQAVTRYRTSNLGGAHPALACAGDFDKDN